MKKTLSLILAALLLASSLAACGKTEPKETEKTATDPVATNAVETKAPETSTPETDAPAPAYATDKITENGAATAHIVVADGADQLLGYAAEELVNHIKLVSGADVTVTNEAQSDSLPIIIATPDTNPELETLFADDLAWLRDTGDGEKVRFGDDGFAIRLLDDKLYIFGATPRGSLNGVYDFIEDNMGVLWIRAENMVEHPTVYDELPTIELARVDYREKSPFNLRSWTLSGNSWETQTMLSRNKLNAFATTPAGFASTADNGGYLYDDIGMDPFITNHNIKWWVTNSPSYDPNNYEYWSTDLEGNHANSAASSQQVNFWSDVTLQCIADSVIAYLDKYSGEAELNYIGICLEDFDVPRVYPEMNEPFEYAPGQTIAAGSAEYVSTVFYSFLNKVAGIVGEKYPNVKITTYAYANVIAPPVCEIADNVYITFCPLAEDLCAYPGESRSAANLQYQNLLDWMKLTPNVQVYNYFGCYTAAPLFERPIWDRIQSDLQLYAANGFNGLVPEGFADTTGEWCTADVYHINNELREPYLRMNNGWSMNGMTFWIYSKLAWNPNEDVDALIKYYCDKVYGDASELMQEYYRLLEMGWDDGRQMMAMEFNVYYVWNTAPEMYWDYFLNIELDGVNIYEALTETLHKAYDAADEAGKERLKYKIEIFDRMEELCIG